MEVTGALSRVELFESGHCHVVRVYGRNPKGFCISSETSVVRWEFLLFRLCPCASRKLVEEEIEACVARKKKRKKIEEHIPYDKMMKTQVGQEVVPCMDNAFREHGKERGSRPFVTFLCGLPNYARQIDSDARKRETYQGNAMDSFDWLVEARAEALHN